jgi:hypothetical protein
LGWAYCARRREREVVDHGAREKEERKSGRRVSEVSLRMKVWRG